MKSRKISVGPTFSERVVKIALSIPKGKVTTYGRLARAAGAGPMASQSITGILGRAWQAGEKKIPWHRIVYADGTVWLEDKHKKERLDLYKKEKIEVDPKTGKIKNFQKILLQLK